MDKDTLSELLRTKHYFPETGNPVYIKQMHLAKGMYAETHKHKYDHYGLLGSGKAVVELDGKSKEYVGPCVITIKADVSHKITSLEDVTWFCIHAVDAEHISDIDEVLIKKEG
jgi:quercetin dioxygenase-like cupin family protein